MSELDDAVEFATLAKNTISSGSSSKRHRDLSIDDLLHGRDEVQPGQPVQYALHADGFAATTPTVKTLKAGCYDIKIDQRAVYAVPMPEPTGLLLELPEMKSEKVLSTIETFWNSEKDYKEGNDYVIGGAQYKGGALIFGPAGSGKSCTIKLAARKMIERDGIVFYCSISPVALIDFLTSFSKIEPHRKCVVVLEDIDTLIENYGESAYLELLDSAKTIDNIFFIATTNYPEKLDPRVYNRPGRFSHVIKIGNPGLKAREAYLKAILKNHTDIPYILYNSAGFSIDHLSSLCAAVYREKKNLQDEIKRLKILFRVPQIDDKTLGFGINADTEEAQ